MKRGALAVLALAALGAASVAGSALGRPSQASTTVTINMAGTPPDFRFTGVRKTMEAGRTTFRFRNTSPGEVRHNFTVVETFGDARPFRSRTLAAGAQQTRTVTLRPGTYIALCTVGEGFHAANGMLRSFTVE